MLMQAGQYIIKLLLVYISTGFKIDDFPQIRQIKTSPKFPLYGMFYVFSLVRMHAFYISMDIMSISSVLAFVIWELIR